MLYRDLGADDVNNKNPVDTEATKFNQILLDKATDIAPKEQKQPKTGVDLLGLLKKVPSKVKSTFNKKTLVKEGAKQVLSGGDGGGGGGGGWGGGAVYIPMESSIIDPYKKPQSTYEKFGGPPPGTDPFEQTLTRLYDAMKR